VLDARADLVSDQLHLLLLLQLPQRRLQRLLQLHLPLLLLLLLLLLFLDQDALLLWGLHAMRPVPAPVLLHAVQELDTVELRMTTVEPDACLEHVCQLLARRLLSEDAMLPVLVQSLVRVALSTDTVAVGLYFAATSQLLNQ